MSDNNELNGSGSSTWLDPLQQLMLVSVKDGPDIYVLALAIRNQILMGNNFKVDSMGNVLPKQCTGFTVQVIPTFRCPDPNQQIVTILRGVIENDLWIVVTLLSDGEGHIIPNMGFLKHLENEQEMKAFCKQIGKQTYVDHAFNEETGLAALKMLPYNPTDRQVEVLASNINERMVVRPDAN
jgi:hypothetical protein